MKALVSGAVILITSVTVVIGANAVIGENAPGDEDENSATQPPASTDDFIHGYDPQCVDDYEGDEGPGFIPLECLRIPGQPDRTPIGLKSQDPCTPNLWEFDPKGCEDAKQLLVPDFGPNLPTIVINGKTVTLPEDVIISGMPGQQRVTIVSGESWVKYSPDGLLVDSQIAPGDEEKMQPIVDALKER